VYSGRRSARRKTGPCEPWRKYEGRRGIHEPAESVVTATEDDPTEYRILECALAADTELLVTGDKKHLLPLGFFRGISTVGLSVFLASFSSG
jgi:predicted nucleic acid-binding protein